MRQVWWLGLTYTDFEYSDYYKDFHCATITLNGMWFCDQVKQDKSMYKVMIDWLYYPASFLKKPENEAEFVFPEEYCIVVGFAYLFW